MTSVGRNLKIIGIVSGLLIFALVAVLITRGPRGVSVIYIGMRPTPVGPRPLFVITNPLPCRITWTMLAPEFQLASGWTTSRFPKVVLGGQASEVRFGGETLQAGTAFEIYGIAPTNVASRYPVLWGLHPADALAQPKWKKVADDWCERIGLRPWFLPHGIERSPVVPPQLSNQAGEANGSQPIRSETNSTSLAAPSLR